MRFFNGESLDASNFEGASINHDLNYPINKSRYKKYHPVLNGDAIEQVFYSMQVLKHS